MIVKLIKKIPIKKNELKIAKTKILIIFIN